MCDCSGGVKAGKAKSNSPPSKTTKTCTLPILEGEVVSVTWKSGVKAAKAKKTIKGPHWKKGTNVNDGAGSQRAAVYLVKSKGGRRDVEVEVKITKSQNVAGNGMLKGKIGDLAIEGSCGTSVGAHKVSAKIKELPEKIAWYKGDISWKLEAAALSSPASLKNSTRVEVFVVLDTPKAFYKKGVWVEALRFLCDKAGVTGEKTAPKAVEKIAKYCHSSHGLRYDTTGGYPAYGCGGQGGTFKLDNYIKAILPVVNCYDQAGALQSLSGALGIDARWCYQGTSPKIFGWINTTNLIGVGSCNNPFYMGNGSAKVVPATDPKRTRFGNHAFCELSSKILDACAGPHTGTESPTQYLTASVDYTETARRGYTAGLAADITHPAGVAKVE